MESLIPENEYKEVDGRVYVNPQIGIDESNTFIDNLRSTQDQQNEQITTDTRMLGTDVPTNLGGLTGAESYFTSRYQVPQTVSNVANLRAAAQAAALNQVLQNEQEIWKKKYQDAYRAYQKRNYDRSRYGLGGGGGNTGGGGSGLNIDTNAGDNNRVKLNINSPKAGEIIPNTDYVSDYQDASTKKWYQLTSPREIDVIAARNSLAGKNPSDGTVVTTPSGKSLRYVAATDSWYEQTNSAGPNTYSPRAR